VSRFLLFYFVFYGGAHLYAYLRICRGLSLDRSFRLLLPIPLLLLFIAPLLSRSLGQWGLDLAATVTSNAGYWWMGLLFLFVSASLPIDMLNILLRSAGKVCRGASITHVPSRVAVVVPALYAAAVAAYGYHEASSIRSEQVTILSDRVPAGRIRIAQISDVHAGQVVREARIRKILAVVAAASPDLVLSTGDLVDGHQRHYSGLEPLFRELNPPLGKYAVTGNHEYYIGLDKAVKFTEEAGFRLLMDERVEVGEHLTIAGIADPGRKNNDPTRKNVEERLLTSANRGRFTLLLKHRPTVFPGSVGRFDLQLSGHVHKGQIFPFNILTWLAYPVHTGLTDLGGGSHIYVSRGTGVWGPPLRFLAPPEVTIIDLVTQEHTPR